MKAYYYYLCIAIFIYNDNVIPISISLIPLFLNFLQSFASKPRKCLHVLADGYWCSRDKLWQPHWLHSCRQCLHWALLADLRYSARNSRLGPLPGCSQLLCRRSTRGEVSGAVHALLVGVPRQTEENQRLFLCQANRGPTVTIEANCGTSAPRLFPVCPEGEEASPRPQTHRSRPQTRGPARTSSSLR